MIATIHADVDNHHLEAQLDTDTEEVLIVWRTGNDGQMKPVSFKGLSGDEQEALEDATLRTYGISLT